jgi:hypothetical protein
LPDNLLSDSQYSPEKKLATKESAGPTTATEHSSKHTSTPEDEGEIIIDVDLESDENELMAEVIAACTSRGELDALIEEDPELYDDLLAACSSVGKKSSTVKSIYDSELLLA